MKKLSRDKVTTRREELGWSQNELARQAGISGAALTAALQHGNPTVRILTAVAEALNTSVDELLEEEPQEGEQLSWCG